MKNYKTTLDSFLKECQKLVDKHMKQYSWESVLSVSKGRRYDKIIAEDILEAAGSSNSKMVWGFVDKTNGDILKPEGWKKPAKHNRGNIFDDNPMLFIGPHGPVYMETIKEYYGA
jgi:hypothetical protein